ncbi:MAG: hypothetical protein U9R26_00800 [Campylobacterota bacterium]|nr:hypothetical protein [Campylobacterota bacterium]
MKNILWILILLLLTGCGMERRADIATPEEISDKTLMFILPSIPEQFCYADHMTEALNEVSDDLNGTNPQVLSVSENLDCSDYGFTNCIYIDMGIGENNKPQSLVECISDDEEHICLFLLGNEYKDVDGNTFDETCILGVDKTVQ